MGNTVAAGAGDEDCLTPGINPPGCDNDSPPRGAANIWVGAAYVFVRSGTTWSEQAFIKANNPRPYNSFGVKLALSGDGNTLAVSAYLEDNAGQGIRPPVPQPFLIVDHLDPWRELRNQAEESGAVYVYTRSESTWTQRAYVKGSNTEAGDEFGSAVALSGDGRLMAVGAHNEDSSARGVHPPSPNGFGETSRASGGPNGAQADNSADDSGAVYVFAVLILEPDSSGSFAIVVVFVINVTSYQHQPPTTNHQMPTDFIVHDKADTVGVAVVEDIQPNKELTGWIMETDETIRVEGARHRAARTQDRARRHQERRHRAEVRLRRGACRRRHPQGPARARAQSQDQEVVTWDATTSMGTA